MTRLLVLLLALFHGWGSFANAVSISHAGAFWSDAGNAAHAPHSPHHDHDAGSEGGHDGADHSHDKMGLPPEDALAALSPGRHRSAARPEPFCPLFSFAFERPPKQLPLS